MKKPLILFALLALSLSACSGSNTDSSADSTSTVSTMETVDVTIDETPGGTFKAGEVANSADIQLTVDSVKDSLAIEVNPEGYKPGSMPAETMSARDGGKFISVSTTVKNETDHALDLTCGFAVQAELGDQKERHYQPIEDLYRVIGNPECNEDLNPGFDSKMTWVFEVPKDVKPEYFYFADPETKYGVFTTVNIDDAPNKAPESASNTDSNKPTISPVLRQTALDLCAAEIAKGAQSGTVVASDVEWGEVNLAGYHLDGNNVPKMIHVNGEAKVPNNAGIPFPYKILCKAYPSLEPPVAELLIANPK